MANLMAHVSASSLNAGCVTLAAGLAARLGAKLIGVAAGYPPPPITSEMGLPVYVLKDYREDIERDLRDLEAGFHKAASGLAKDRRQWRSAIADPCDFLAQQARAADLVLASSDWRGESAAMAARPADLVLTAGRPVMVVPPGIENLNLDCALIAWKDGPEARRALLDALGLLKLASRVLVCGVGREVASKALDDVALYLADHEIAAEAIAEPGKGAVGPRLRAVAAREGADLIVAGAYGHSRVREWALGGVTLDLLEKSETCCLLSH